MVAIHIAVRDAAAGGSAAVVRYDLVATTADGDRYVRDYATTFPHMAPRWQAALDAMPSR